MNSKITIRSLILPVILIGPWLNVMVRHGFFYYVIAVFSFTMLLGSVFLLLSKNNYYRSYFFDTKGITLLMLVVVSIALSFMYHIYSIGFVSQQVGYLTFTRFYGTLFFLSGFWFILYMLGVKLESRLYFFAKYFFIASFINIIWGGMINIYDLPKTWELIQHSDYVVGNHGRPYGLTGNAAVNSTTLVILYFIILRGSEKKYFKNSWKWLAALCVGIYMQNSGSGYFALAIVIFYHLRKAPSKVSIPLFLLIPLFYVLWVYSGVFRFYRISPEYLTHNYLVNLKNIQGFININFSYLDVLFGKAIPLGSSNQILTMDFGPLFLINQMGLLFFIFVSLLLVLIAFRSSSPVDKYIIFVIFLTGIHYQAIFFLSTSIIFSMYMIVALSDRKIIPENIPNSILGSAKMSSK